MPEFQKGTEFRVSGVALTQAGRELQRMVDPEYNQQFLEDLNEFFRKNNLQMTEVALESPYISRID